MDTPLTPCWCGHPFRAAPDGPAMTLYADTGMWVPADGGDPLRPRRREPLCPDCVLRSIAAHLSAGRTHPYPAWVPPTGWEFPRTLIDDLDRWGAAVRTVLGGYRITPQGLTNSG